MITNLIGFKENKKCNLCPNMAYYEVSEDNQFPWNFCSECMKGFIESREEDVNN